MSSLKMTFSLTSLVFLIALGLVFAPMSVMAHGPSTIGNLRSHTHPVNTEIPGQDLNADGDTTDTGEGAVSTHNAHPIPTLSLKPDAADATTAKVRDNKVVIASVDSQTNAIDANEFVLVVDFDQDVVNNNTTEEVNRATETLPTLTFLNATLNANGVTITNGVSLGTPTRFGTAADKNEDDSKFEIVVLVDPTAIPTGSDALKTVTVRLQLRQTHDDGDNNTTESGAYSLATMPLFTQVPGGASEASNFFEITLVKEFPKAPDTTAPTVEVTAPTELNKGKADFTITFSEQLGTGFSAFDLNDVTITGGTATAADLTGPAKKDDDSQEDDVYKLVVTPDDPAPAAITVSLADAMIADPAGNTLTDFSKAEATYTYPDETPPTIISAAEPKAPEKDGTLKFTFTFSELLKKQLAAGGFQTSDVDVKGGTATAVTYPKDDAANDDGNFEYIVTVKPEAKIPSVTVKIKEVAGGITDKSDNVILDYTNATVTYTYLDLPPDTTAPTVMITVLSADPSSGKHMLDKNALATVRFELTFSEPLAKANAVPGSISQLELEDFTIHDHNGKVLSDATQNPIGASLSPHTPAPNSAKESYILTVPTIYPTGGSIPDDRPVDVAGRQLEVHIELRPRTATDVVGNPVPTTTKKFDTIPPMAEIYPGYLTLNGKESLMGNTWNPVPAAPTVGGVPRTALTFLFVFSEELSPQFSTTDIHRALGDNFTLESNAVPRPHREFTIPAGYVDDPDPHDFQIPEGYLVTATIVDKFASTTVLLKREEVADEAKNLLQEDEHVTYLPSANKPVVVIKAADIFNCGVPGNHVEVTITDAEAIKAGESITEKEITVSKGWKIKTGTFTSPKSTAAGAKTVRATFNVIRKDVESPADRSWLGEQAVTITVAADAIKDDTDQGHDKKDGTYTAGPVIAIPAGAYVVVIRTESWYDTHLQSHSRLYLGDYNVRASLLDVWDWNCMPDLGLIFDVTTDASPGIGGGGLMVMQSRKHVADPNVKGSEKIKKGTVGISEIMWSEDRGIPFGFRSNIAHAQEQWIELHNTNNFEVKVTLFDLIRTEAYRTNDADYEKIGMVDIMSNYDIGGRWDVQAIDDKGTADDTSDDVPKYGADGNSERGYDFISMQRKSKDKDHEIDYSHNDYQGRNQANWSASPYVYLTRRAGLADRGIQLPNENLNYDFRGSPARSNAIPAPGPITKTTVTRSPVIFNEIANRRDQSLEWIELRNVTDAEVNLRNYQISIVTAKGTDKAFYTFPNDDGIKIAANGLLLLVDTDPRDNDTHPVAVGYNIKGGNDQALGIGDDAPRYVVTDFAEGGLPNDGKFVLILRKPSAADKTDAKPGNDTRVVDLAGYDDDLADPSIHTDLWPLKVFPAPFSHGALNVETVNFRRDAGRDGTGGEKNEAGKTSFNEVGYTGIGYKRHAQRIAAHGGTPGYEDTRKNLVADVDKAEGLLSISEIMFDQGDGQYPQWIEIYNSSNEPVNLHSEAGWRLIIENYDDGVMPVRALSGTLNFKNSDVQTILPKQTVMVVSTRARNSGSAFFDTRVIFPATRVFSAWDDQRAEFDMRRSTDPILSEDGFYIELIDGKGTFSDGVGNLVKSPNRRVAAEVAWTWEEINAAPMEGQTA